VSQTEEAMYRLMLVYFFETIVEPRITMLIQTSIPTETMARLSAEGLEGVHKWEEIRRSWVGPVVNSLFPGDSRLIEDMETYAMKRKGGHR
jgi:hypothetical protein